MLDLRLLRFFLRRHRIAIFLLLTYSWTWGVGVPAALEAHGALHFKISNGALTLAGFSPTVVAFALLFAADGTSGAGLVWRRVWQPRWRRYLWWYAVVLIGPILAMGLCMLVLPIVGRQIPTLGPWYYPFVATLFLVPLTGFLEEVGWRGFLQDNLERKLTPLAASLVVAAAWGPWHLPTIFRLNSEGARTPLLATWFLVGVVPLSVLCAWIYHQTERRLLPVIVFHAAIDAGAGYFFGPVPAGDLRPFIMWVALLVVGAAVVVWKDGAWLGCRDSAGHIEDDTKQARAASE